MLLHDAPDDYCNVEDMHVRMSRSEIQSQGFRERNVV
jgi:hypothetical protein